MQWRNSQGLDYHYSLSKKLTRSKDLQISWDSITIILSLLPTRNTRILTHRHTKKIKVGRYLNISDVNTLGIGLFSKIKPIRRKVQCEIYIIIFLFSQELLETEINIDLLGVLGEY